jgi:multidrug transporter EmrE-like cation transporter
MKTTKVLFIVIAISVVTVVGDYFIKLASMEARQLANRWFGVGCAMYLLSTVGWVFVMPHMKLAVIGVIYSLSVVILMALLGVFVFGESITRYEVAGLVLGASAILLLGRHVG